MSLSVSSSGSFASAFAVGTRSFSRATNTQDVEAEFLKIARQSPVERMRSAILKKMGLTEEDLQAMDPKTRAEIEKTIREEIAKQMKAHGDQSAGVLADLKA